MKTLKEFINSKTDLTDAINEFLVLEIVANDDMIFESKADLKAKIKAAADKAGLHVSKSRGLISVVLSAGKILGQFFLAAIRGDTEKIKAIANTEITKEEFLDFLFKLDTATLHLVTGPIHAIDAITGWHIGANLHNAAVVTKDAIDTAVKNIRKVVDVQPDVKLKKQMFGYIRGLQRILLGN